MAVWTPAGQVAEVRDVLGTLPPPLPAATPPRPPAATAAAGGLLTNPALPPMANAVCVYCLLAGPALWVVGNLACCVSLAGPPQTPAELLLSFGDSVVTAAITAFLAVAGWRYRALDPAGGRLVLYGLCGSLGWCVAHLALAVVAAAADPPPAVVAAWCAGGLGGLAGLGFEVAAAIWLAVRGPGVARPMPAAAGPGP